MNYGSSDEQYIIKVITNQEEVGRLQAALEKEEAALRKVIASLQGQTQAQIASNAAVQAGVGNLQALGAQLNQVQSAAGVSAQKFLNLGRMLDDLQYVPQQGLRPIINNVMEMAPAIGIAMIAVQALIQNWDSLAKLFGMGATKTEAEQMEELGKKTKKTADEYARYKSMKEKAANVDATTDIKSDEQDAQEKAFDEAIKASGGSDKVKAGIELDLMDGGVDGVSNKVAGTSYADYTKAKGHQDKWAKGSVIYDEQASLMKAAKEANRLAVKKSTEDILGAARANPNDRQRLQDMIGRNPDNFADGTADAFAASTPKARAKEAEEDADWEAQQAGHESWKTNKGLARDKAKAEADAAKERDKESGQLADAAIDENERSNKEYQRAKAARFKEDVAKAKDTGIFEPLKEAFESVAKGGGNMDTAKAQMKEQLSGKFGAKVAGELVNDAAGDGQRAAMRNYLSDLDKKGPTSETIGSADFASKIQAGVTKDKTAEKQLAILQIIAKNTTPKSGPAAEKTLTFK